MTLAEQILEALIIHPRLTRRVLLCMSENTKGVYRVLQKLDTAGLISVKKVSGLTDSVISITSSGILRLSATGDIAWLQKVGVGELAALSLYDASADGSRGRRGYIERNDADLLCSLAGMDTLLLPQYTGTVNDTYGNGTTNSNRQTISPGQDLIYSRLKEACPSYLCEKLISRDWYTQSENGYGRTSFISKPAASQLLGMAGPDFKSARISGIALGKARTLLVYNPLRKDFIISLKDEDRDMLVWRRLAYSLPQFEISAMPCGIIFVNDVASFASLCMQDGFGEGFYHLHAVSRTCKGTAFLRWLMSNSENDIRGAVIPCFKASRFGPESPLPINVGGVPCCIGCTMDMRVLQQVRGLCSSGSISNVGVICFPWQREYYRAVLPEAELMFVEHDE